MKKLLIFLLFLSGNATAAFHIVNREIVYDKTGDVIRCVVFEIEIDNHGVWAVPICDLRQVNGGQVIINLNAQEDITNQSKIDIRDALRNEVLQKRAELISKQNSEDAIRAKILTRKSKISLPINDGDVN